MLKSMLERIKRHKTFNEAYRQLSSLTDRELTDIGITRGMIKELSYKTAYGDSK